MAGLSNKLGNLLAELRRRRVLRVAGVYAITVWVILEVADNTFEPLGVVPWVHTSLIIALIAAFPVIVVLAWVFDITQDGLVRTAPSQREARLNEFGDAVAEHPRLWIDMLVIVVLLTIVAFLLLRPGEPPLGERSPSIAVLPFLDISEHRDNEYFSDGLTEALVASLARMPGLQVASATSSFAYKGQHPDIKYVGEQLGVSTVLEGSVRKAADDKLKVTAQLIDTRTNFHLWSETYNGSLDDIFAFQEDIARSIASALHLSLVPEQPELLDSHVTSDVEAYDLYLRGRAELRSALTHTNIEHAIEFFEEAIRIDPRFGLADAGLCSAYWEMYELTRDDDFIDRASDSCNTAKARVTGMPDLHAAIGWLYTGTGRHDLAEREFTRALSLDTAHVEALRGIGVVQWRTGNLDDAEATLRKVIAADPSYWRGYASLGVLLYRTGRYAESADASIRGIERNPEHPHLHLNLGAAYGAMGDFEKSARAFKASAAAYPSAAAYANVGSNLFYLGRFEEAREMFAEALSLSPGLYELHFSLADACRQLPDGGDCAEEHYRRALALAQERVSVAPNHARSAADLALLHARIGDMAAARDAAGWAMEQDFTGYEVPRSLAVIAMIDGDHARALELLEEARDKGYPPHILSVHPDFNALRDDERFKSLVASEHDEI